MEAALAVESNFAEVMQKVLARFQSERDRIVAKAREKLTSPSSSTDNGDSNVCSLPEFRRNAEFDELLSRLLATPLGSIEVGRTVSSGEETSDEGFHDGSEMSNQSLVTKDEKKEQVKKETIEPTEAFRREQVLSDDEKCRNSHTRRRKLARRWLYDDMEVVKIIDGKDRLGDKIVRPTAVVTIPDASRFAVMHENRISVISCVGRLKATYVVDDSLSLSKPFGWRCLRANPATGQLYRLHCGEIQTIHPARLPSDRTSAKARRAVMFNSGSPPSGFAISSASDQLFTAMGKNLLGFQLAPKHIARSQTAIIDDRFSQFPPSVVNIRESDNLLFYSTHNGSTLNTIPIGPNSKLVREESRVIFDGFSHHSGVTFDLDNNILIAHRSGHNILVLSPDGEESLSVVRPAASYGPFIPSDIAMLEVPEGGELFDIADDLHCSRIVVTPDFNAERIVVFGCPHDVS